VKIEKRLILYSVIALMVGVAAISPLMFLMSVKADAAPEEQPQFNINLRYLYIDNYLDNSSEKNSTSILHARNANSDWVPMAYAMVFNATPNFDPKGVTSDAIFEYYIMEVSSEKGFIGNAPFSSYASFNVSQPWGSFIFSRDKWFNSTQNEYMGGQSGSLDGTSIGFRTGPGLDWNRSLGEPETLTISVRRQGWVILSNNVTTAHLADSEVILQIQLEKFGDGFIYNDALSEDELAQIDPMYPHIKIMK
jgi:hypothetical protein